MAIALLRRENALAYLLDLVRNGADQASADAAAALAIYEKDPNLQERLDLARKARD